MRWGLVLLVAALVFAALVGAVALRARRGAPVRASSVLVIELEGDLPEQDLRSPIELVLEGERPVLRVLTGALEKAKRDDRIKAVYLRCRGVDAGFAKLQEVRDAIRSFRESGKKTFAFLEMGFGADYYLASSADVVTMIPTGFLDVSGLMSDVMFFKGTLDKLGVKAELEHIGDYKSASDIFTRDGMSEADREATNAILDSLYGQIRSDLAEARKISEEEVTRWIDTGLFTGQAAVEAKLVDELIYEDQVVEEIAREAGEDFPRISPESYVRPAGEGRGPVVAVVYATGGIVTGESAAGPLGESVTGSDTLVEVLQELRARAEVRAVVLRIDSPGGSVIASDAIHREAQLLAAGKPLVVSMSDVAASGGYYIAMPAGCIVAQPGTLTGSIGVVSGKFNLRGLYDWVGLRREQIKRGRNADIFSDYTPFTEEQRVMVREQMRSVYDGFVAKASEARKRSPEEIERAAQGRVWTGQQALEVGLVDEMGGLDRAIAIAKEKAGIPQGRSVSLEVHPRKRSLLQMLSRGDSVRAERALGSLPPGMRRAAVVWATAARLRGEPVLLWDPRL